MKQVENRLMKEYRKEYNVKRKSFNKQFKLGYESEELKDDKFELDIMKLSIRKYSKERKKYGK